MQEVTNAVRQMRFPQKLWYLLDMHTDAILWGGTGRTILLNYRVLHTYLQSSNSIFKTTNISSFVRQLNLYGFRKVTSHLQDPLCNSSNPYMHEYMHDFFQFDRPELLNNITRKALTMKKSFKAKSICGANDQFQFLTPLEKARRALQIALKEAIQDSYRQDSQNPLYITEYEEDNGDIQEEDDIEIDWTVPCETIEEEKFQPQTGDIQPKGNSVDNNSGDSSHTLINLTDEPCPQATDNYPTQFLSMPDLEAESTEENCVELLAEYNINDEIDKDITKKKNKGKENNSLNCVLPSVSNDQNDEMSLSETAENTNHYHGEWDQMFNDIMINRSSSQESVSNLKELYSQISQTIDLLNS